MRRSLHNPSVNIFISIVSHLHHDVIINLATIKKLQKYENIYVICRDNKPVTKLEKYCKKYDATYIPNTRECGFSSNNNQNFLYCQEHLGMENSDLFILLNPDIFICENELEKLIAKLSYLKIKISTCDLYLDREYMVQDDNIRVFPKFLNFVKTYLLNDRSTMVNRVNGIEVTQQHWASGSFLIIEADLYKKLNGLDESYYMYCEDIDFCQRARMLGYQFSYIDSVKAVHYRRRNSKRFLSKYFIWHVGSVFRYSFLKRTLEAKKSCLTSK